MPYVAVTPLAAGKLSSNAIDEVLNALIAGDDLIGSSAKFPATAVIEFLSVLEFAYKPVVGLIRPVISMTHSVPLIIVPLEAIVTLPVPGSLSEM